MGVGSVSFWGRHHGYGVCILPACWHKHHHGGITLPLACRRKGAGGEGGPAVWWAMAAGAVAGYGLSLMTPSRHGFWVALGVVAGFALHWFRHRHGQAASEAGGNQRMSRR